MFNPPAHKSTTAGQITMDNWKPPRYLRDVIKAAQERSSEEFATEMATSPSTDAEKRLENVFKALRSLIQQETSRRGCDTWWATELRCIINENSA